MYASLRALAHPPPPHPPVEGDILAGLLVSVLEMVDGALYNKENLGALRDRAYDLLLVVSENAGALRGQPGQYEKHVALTGPSSPIPPPTKLPQPRQHVPIPIPPTPKPHSMSTRTPKPYLPPPLNPFPPPSSYLPGHHGLCP